MTDLEMAKTFVEGEHYVCRWDMEQSDLEEIAIEAYLAGLRAGSQLDRVWHDYDAGEDCYEDSHEGRWVMREDGRPKVHDLRKNPDDLPPVGIGVIISGYLGDMKGLLGLDEWDGEKWTNTDMPGLVREAWCEVPKFEGGK